MGRRLMKKKFIHLTVGFFVAYFWISALAYADGYTRWTRYLENNKTTIDKATIISYTLAIKSSIGYSGFPILATNLCLEANVQNFSKVRIYGENLYYEIACQTEKSKWRKI